MSSKLKDDNIDFLFRAILELETIDDCYDFFEDLCTVQELKTISQRIVVANATGASTATISRVNRSLQYGCDGYDKIFEKIKLEDENKNEENEEL